VGSGGVDGSAECDELLTGELAPACSNAKKMPCVRDRTTVAEKAPIRPEMRSTLKSGDE
jgi:hypothetical protein